MTRTMFTRGLLRLLLVAACSGAGQVWALVISANYGAGWTADQKTSFEFAGQTIASYLPTAYTGETITVDARWQAMTLADGVTPDLDVLGYGLVAFPFQWWTNFGSASPLYRSDTWYPAALANHLHGSDISSAAEMSITFNSNFANWYFGIDGNSGGNYDFATIAMHELMHGLGFNSLVQEDGTLAMLRLVGTTFEAVPTPLPSIWDRHVQGDDGHGEVKPLGSMDQQERASALATGSLTWSGAEGNAAYGGGEIPIYSPTVFRAGSSLHHIDQSSFPDLLMRPFFSTGATHTLSAMEVGMLHDIGWVPEPPTLPMLVCALALLWLGASRRTRR